LSNAIRKCLVTHKPLSTDLSELHEVTAIRNFRVPPRGKWDLSSS